MGTIIGEVSAVAGVIQFANSLATTLYAYVGDYKDAPDDIEQLARDITAVVAEVHNIRTLVEQDQAARDLDKAGKDVAEKCVGDLERCLAKLSELLSKAGVTTGLTADPAPDNKLAVSRRMKFQWPRIKPKVEEVQRKLDRTRIQIVLARTCIMSRIGPTPQKLEARLTVPGLQKGFRRLERMEKQRLRFSNDLNRAYVAGLPHHKNQPIKSFLDGKATIDSAPDSLLITEVDSDVLRDQIREELREEEIRKRDETAREDQLRGEAVEEYKRTVEADVKQSRDRAIAVREHLERVFGLSAKEQIDTYVQEQQTQGVNDAIARLVLAASPANELRPSGILDKASSDDQRTTKRKRARFPRLSFWKRESTPTPERHGNIMHSPTPAHSVPSIPGTSQTYASAAERDVRFAYLALSYHTDYSEEIQCTPFDGLRFSHYPCGTACDFKTTMSIWSQIPLRERNTAFEQAYQNFSSLHWKLHAAIPITTGAQGRRAALSGLTLRTRQSFARRGKRAVLLIFSASGRLTSEPIDRRHEILVPRSDRSTQNKPIYVTEYRDHLPGGLHRHTPTARKQVSDAPLHHSRDHDRVSMWLNDNSLARHSFDGSVNGDREHDNSPERLLYEKKRDGTAIYKSQRDRFAADRATRPKDLDPMFKHGETSSPTRDYTQRARRDADNESDRSSESDDQTLLARALLLYTGGNGLSDTSDNPNHDKAASHVGGRLPENQVQQSGDTCLEPTPGTKRNLTATVLTDVDESEYLAPRRGESTYSTETGSTASGGVDVFFDDAGDLLT